MTYTNPNPRRFVVVVDLDADDLDESKFTKDDVEEALAARLGPEACFDGDGNPIHGGLVVAQQVPPYAEEIVKSLVARSDEPWSRGWRR